MIKKYHPATKSLRHTTVVHYRGVITTNEPHKALVSGGKRYAGRNARGRITVRHQGGGHKLLYRDGDRRYALLPQKVKVGDEILSGDSVKVAPGNRLPLGSMPVGTFVYNIELKPGGGGKMVRSAGVFAEVIAQDAGQTHVRLPSTEVRKFTSTGWATVGEVSNPDHHLVNIGKAGRSRWLGVRPTVRGTAMNPVDHPHGGGEGRQGRGLRRAKTAWGKPSGKGQKTRSPKKYSNVFIVSRRKVGKKK